MQVARKRNFLTKKSELPPGMKQVEYIEKVSGQNYFFINRNIHPDNRSFEIQFSWSVQRNGDIKFFTLGGNFQVWQSRDENGIRIWGSDGEWHQASASNAANVLFKLYASSQVNNGQINIEKGTSFINTGKHINGLTNNPTGIYLFAYIDNYTTIKAYECPNNLQFRSFYSMSFNDQYESVNLIPVKYNNQIGIYDTIRNEFIMDTGSGMDCFIAGPEIN